ncbi:KIF-binding protein [Lycorma delicatula]|uniref:KIF-binding protein n=1 Tax=Lycorma delicatula TaxID=130591 RepID=UPI003F5102D8
MDQNTGNSSVDQDTLIDLAEKYEKVETLLEESRRDPETEPYKSKYAAMKILKEMKSKLVGLLDDIRSSDVLYERLKAMLGAVWLSMGTVSVDTEELSSGEEYLSNCLKSLEENSLKPCNILIVLSSLNQLGILWSNRGENEKSHGFLIQAEQLYNEYHEQVDEIPNEICNLFSMNEKPKLQTKAEKSIEKIHTLTLYYLAQIYGALGNPIKSSVYCHNTLKRQLEGKDSDPVEWALNSATLAQFFMEKSAFRLARHHLAAACYVLEQHETSLLASNDYNEEERAAMMERVNHRFADVARCWAKYGVVLLSASKDRLMSSDDYSETPNVTPAKSNAVYPEFSGLQFTILELSSYEEEVTANHVLMYDDAKLVFLNAQQWLNRAKEFYSLENHASDYVQIIQDWSQLYRYLAFFKDDPAEQCKLHKKRINLLEDVIAELNPSYYSCVCRELWFELGETYSTILDAKVQRMQDNPERPTAHALKKINFLASKAINAYNSFLDLLKDIKTKEFPKEFSADLEHAALISYFYLGRLYSKLVSPDKAVQLQNTKKSYEHYKMVVDYCEVNENAKQHIAMELSVCVEMVKLLPVKMLKISSVI